MNLWIANCTRQNQRVYYRLDFMKDGTFIAPTQRAGQQARGPKLLEIPARDERPITGLERPQIKDIIEQLAKYGLRAHDEKPGRDDGIIPFIYREDARVPRSAVAAAVVHNQGIRAGEGKRRRTAAAIAAHQAIINATDEEPAETVVEFEQEREEGDDGKNLIADGVRVKPKMDDSPPPVAGARRRAA